MGYSKNVNAEMSDTIKMRNGNIIVGEFLGWQNNEISFSIQDAGTVTVKYGKVSMLHARSNKFYIETLSGKIYHNTLKCIKEEEFFLIDNGVSVSVKFNEIEVIRPEKKGKLISSFLGMGYNFSQSTDFGLVTVDGGAYYKNDKWIVDGMGNCILVHNKSNGVDRIRELVNIKADRNLNARWQLAARYIYQRNKELGLAFRHLTGSGLLFKLIKKSTFHLNISSGLAAMIEGTIDNQSYQRFEFPFFLEAKLSGLGNSNVSLYHSQILFVGFGNSRRIRHDGELRLNWLVKKKLTLTTYIFNNYDNTPMQRGIINNFDFGWNTGIRYTFSD